MVAISPTKIWIENGLFGERTVMVQHEGCDPFPYAVFGYDYRYTDNATTWRRAHDLAVSLGATQPVEVRAAALPEPQDSVATITDTQRMDWLTQRNVQVREPLLFGSEPVFTAVAIEDDGESDLSSPLRRLVDERLNTPSKAGRD